MPLHPPTSAGHGARRYFAADFGACSEATLPDVDQSCAALNGSAPAIPSKAAGPAVSGDHHRHITGRHKLIGLLDDTAGSLGRTVAAAGREALDQRRTWPGGQTSPISSPGGCHSIGLVASRRRPGEARRRDPRLDRGSTAGLGRIQGNRAMTAPFLHAALNFSGSNSAS